MICLIRKDEKVWTTQNVRLTTIQRLENEHGNNPDFSQIVAWEVSKEIGKGDTLWMRKNAPMNAYSLKYHPEIKSKEKGSIGYENFHGKQTLFARQEAKAIFDNCEAHGFVESRETTKEMFRLTKAGRTFSGVTGLLLEWQKLTKPIYIAGAIVIAWVVRELIPLIIKFSKAANQTPPL